MVEISDEKIEQIGNLLNDTNRPLKERFRALFTLRNLGGSVAIEKIAKCFADKSALLKHELAYCLGQMQDSSGKQNKKKIIEEIVFSSKKKNNTIETLSHFNSHSTFGQSPRR